ncbi:MAG: MFS transporter, partial [Ktedonobacteraceae bacterium]
MRQEKSVARDWEGPPAQEPGRVERILVDGEGQPNKWAVMAVLAIGILMATLDSSIVNISLPSIAHYFVVPLSGAVEWVIISYLIVIAGVLLTVGRLADMVGRKTLWIVGLVVFTLGSATCGAAPT